MCVRRIVSGEKHTGRRQDSDSVRIVIPPESQQFQRMETGLGSSETAAA